MPSKEVVISKTRGRPLYLPEKLNEKLWTFLIAQRAAGENINRHTVYGVLMGFIRSYLHFYGGYLEFTATDGSLYSFYKRMYFIWRTVTKSRLVVTEALWTEIQTLFLHNICTLVQTYNIPDELIINVNQTASKYVLTSSVTMAKKNPKHVPKHGADDKHAIALALAETFI